MGLRKILRNYLYKNKFKRKTTFSSENETILVTGANSGIGLAIVKKLLHKNKVIGLFNKSSSMLESLNHSNLIIKSCDLNDVNQINSLKNIFEQNNISYIIHSACHFPPKNDNLCNINVDEILKSVKINSLSILNILKILKDLDKLKYVKKIMNISSQTGSTSLNKNGGSYSYRLSKNMLNSVSKNLSIDLNIKNKIDVFAIHPGLVKTKLNQGGLVSTTDASEKLLYLLFSNKKLNGKFISLPDFKEIPW